MVQQDFKILTQLQQSFQNKTGKRKGDPKGVDKTHQSRPKFWPRQSRNINPTENNILFVLQFKDYKYL